MIDKSYSLSIVWYTIMLVDCIFRKAKCSISLTWNKYSSVKLLQVTFLKSGKNEGTYTNLSSVRITRILISSSIDQASICIYELHMSHWHFYEQLISTIRTSIFYSTDWFYISIYNHEEVFKLCNFCEREERKEKFVRVVWYPRRHTHILFTYMRYFPFCLLIQTQFSIYSQNCTKVLSILSYLWIIHTYRRYFKKIFVSLI